MSTIEIRKPHSLGREAARAKAEEIANGLKDRFSLDWEWAGDSVLFEAKGGAAKGTKGRLVVREAEIEVNLDLPFQLRPLKGVVESKIREKLERLSKSTPS
jgi:putative polyhydroxyalkanoate system protein